MATSCDDGGFVWLLANEAGKGDALQHGHLSIVLVVLGLVPVGARNHGPTQVVLLPFGDILPVSIKLPALLIIASVVKKFATISKSTPTGGFIIFAYVGSEIGDGRGAGICRGLSDRTDFRVLVEPVAPFRRVVCSIERDVTISLADEGREKLRAGFFVVVGIVTPVFWCLRLTR